MSGSSPSTTTSVNYGAYGQVDDARAVTLKRAFETHPDRFNRMPRPPRIQTEVWINKLQKEPILTPTKIT